MSKVSLVKHDDSADPDSRSSRSKREHRETSAHATEKKGSRNGRNRVNVRVDELHCTPELSRPIVIVRQRKSGSGNHSDSDSSSGCPSLIHPNKSGQETDTTLHSEQPIQAESSLPIRIHHRPNLQSPPDNTLKTDALALKAVAPSTKPTRTTYRVTLPKSPSSNSPENTAIFDSSSTTTLERDTSVVPDETLQGDRTSIKEDGEESDVISEECETEPTRALDAAMRTVKTLLLQELLAYALSSTTAAPNKQTASQSRGDGGSTSSNLSSSRVDYGNSRSEKRPRGKNSRNTTGGNGDGDGDGDDDTSDDRPKKRKDNELPDPVPQCRLKCPFYQRQPNKYTKAACRGRGFVDMAKLKDHIKRVHTQPLRCSRCWKEMKSDEVYSEHLQQESICEKNNEPQEDRIRPQLLKRLDFKKAPYANARNVDDKWKMMFSVLFPYDIIIPSPYEQQGMSPQLELALSEALEEELTRELAIVIDPIMDRIRGCIPAILESCRQKMINNALSSDEDIMFAQCDPSSGTISSDGERESEAREVHTPNSSVTSRSPKSGTDGKPISRKARGKLPARAEVEASTADEIPPSSALEFFQGHLNKAEMFHTQPPGISQSTGMFESFDDVSDPKEWPQPCAISRNSRLGYGTATTNCLPACPDGGVPLSQSFDHYHESEFRYESFIGPPLHNGWDLGDSVNDGSVGDDSSNTQFLSSQAWDSMLKEFEAQY